MNFYNIIQNILGTSSKHKNVKEVSEGDIYVYLNSGEHKYPCVFLTVGEVADSEMSRNVNCTLFYVDRLSSDQSNRTVVQSLGITTLGDILDTIEGDVVSVNYTTFTEKFADMCAGVFATVDITYPLGEVCDEHFEVRRLEITENGIYDTIGYDEFVIEVVNEELVERVEELQQEVEEYITNIEQKEVEISQLENEVSIKEKQINSVTSLSITENGNYTPEEGVLGWNNINVNVTNPTDVWMVPNGVKFRGSTFTSLPARLDFSNVTDFGRMFYDCYNLSEISQIDTSNGTIFSYMFSSCSNLKTIPLIDTSKGTSFDRMFDYCTNLKTITQLDLSSATTSINGIFSNCPSINDVTFVGSINVSFSLEYVYSLNYNSVKSILTACSNTTKPTTSKILKFSRTLTDQNGELAALVATCNSKGWTISGLTLN